MERRREGRTSGPGRFLRQRSRSSNRVLGALCHPALAPRCFFRHLLLGRGSQERDIRARTWTVSSTTFPIIKPRSGGFMPPGAGAAVFLSTLITWARIARTRHSSADLDGFFDNVPDHQTAFWGLYATRRWRRGVSFDTYYLGEDRKNATFERGTATDLRFSLGTRLWRPIATKEAGW